MDLIMILSPQHLEVEREQDVLKNWPLNVEVALEESTVSQLRPALDFEFHVRIMCRIEFVSARNTVIAIIIFFPPDGKFVMNFVFA